MSGVDWVAIRAEYEDGISQHSLAAKYGITQQAISKRARKEQWIVHIHMTPVHQVVTRVTDDNQQQPGDLSTVDNAIDLISRRLAEEPENKDIKMLMDSLSQAYKIKYMLPAEQGDTSAYDMRELLSFCTEEERAIIKPIFAAATERKKLAQEKLLQKTG